MQKQITLANMIEAARACNEAYKARNVSPMLNKAGVQDDVAAGIKHWERFTAAQWEAIKALGIDASIVDGLSATGNVKVFRRMPSLIEFCITGEPRALQGSAKTAVIELLALEAGAKDRAALAFAATGRGNEHTSDTINVEQARLFMRALGGQKVGIATEPTQNSVAFGKGNLCAILGAAIKDSRKGHPVHNRANNVFRAIAKHVNRITERDVIALETESEKKANKRKGK